jgi:peptide/nickel transport system substrate-binding protein
VSALRRALEPEQAPTGRWQLLLTRPPGYLLDVSPEAVDAHVFRRLAAEGRRELARGDASSAAETLGRALDLWRGLPLADLGDAPVVRTAAGLEQLRLDVVEDRVDAELALGQPVELVPRLFAMVAEEPLRERRRGQLMLALYRTGRQAEALRVYDEGRTLLADELGIDPSPESQRLFDRILHQDPGLEPPPAPAPRPSVTTVWPAADRPPQRSVRRRRLAWVTALVTAVAAVVVLTRGSGPAQAGGLEPGALGLIDLTTGTAKDQVALGELPAALLVQDDTLWAALSGRGVVASTDAGTPQTLREVVMDPGIAGLTYADSAIWVTQPESDAVVRVDVRSGRVTQRVAVGGRPGDVVTAGGSVWVTSRLEDTVSRIDPRSGRVLRTVPVGRDPVALAGDDHSLWVAAAGDGSLTRIGLPDGQSVERYRGIGMPADLTLAGDDLWVSDPAAGTLSRIDTQSGAVVQAVPIARGVSGLAAVSDTVVAANRYDGRLVVVDSSTGGVVRRLETGRRPVVVYSDGTRLWAAAGVDAPQGDPQTLRVLATGPIESPDPAWPGGLYVTSLTHDGLVGFRRLSGSDGAQIVADLATAIPVPTDGGRTWTFRLQAGVRYSTGGTVRPGDVRPSIERAIAAGTPLLPLLRGAGTCGDGRCDLTKGITADEEARTVTFHLRHPDPDFLTELALPAASVLPQGTGPMITPEDVAGVDWSRFPATGPYQVQSVQLTTLVLTRNPAFTAWAPDTTPDGSVERIEVTYGADPGDVVDAVLHGSADLVLDPPVDRLEELAVRYPTSLTLVDQPATLGLMLDTRHPPFDDPRARKAVAMAVDRRAVIGALSSAPARPSCQVLPPVVVGYRPYCPYGAGPGSDRSDVDLDAARRLVRETGTAGDAVTVLVPDSRLPEGRVVARTLHSVGYRVELETVVDESTYFERIANPDTAPQAHLLTWGADLPTASSFAGLARCANATPGGVNTTGYCDQTAERLMDRALALQQTDPSRAATAWQAVDRRLTDTVAWVPLASMQRAVLTSSGVAGLVTVPGIGPALEKIAPAG